MKSENFFLNTFLVRFDVAGIMCYLMIWASLKIDSFSAKKYDYLQNATTIVTTNPYMSILML